GDANGTAVIELLPASGAPSGFNTYSVINTGSTVPYNAFAGPVSSNTLQLNGLSKGTYSVAAFDGSCKYTTTFNVSELVYDFTLTPLTSTLCPGSSTPASVNFTSQPSLSQYSYSWSPTSWMVGGNGSLQNTIITPTGIPNGSVVTQIYTVVVTPSLAFCPQEKTLA